MAKTIKLLSTWNGFKPYDIITVDDLIATLLLPHNATLDLSGGTPAYQSAPGQGLSSGTNLPKNQTIRGGEAVDVTVPSGVSLGLTSANGTTATWSVINPDGSLASPTTIPAGQSTVGIFTVDTKIRFIVTFGSVVVKAGVVAGSVKSAPLYFLPIDPATGEPYKITGGSGGTFDGTVTIPEGGDATVGTKADAPATDPTAANTVVALTKAQTIAAQELVKRGDTYGQRIQPAKRPGTNRSMLITTTSQTVIPANANSWFLANDSTADILINIGAAATATDSDTEGTFKLRPGERLSSRDVVETGAVNAVVASGTARLKARST